MKSGESATSSSSSRCRELDAFVDRYYQQKRAAHRNDRGNWLYGVAMLGFAIGAAVTALALLGII
jgi:hypothetical protein